MNYSEREIECLGCGNTFMRNQRNQKYCTIKCYKNAWYRRKPRKKPLPQPPRECAECGGDFAPSSPTNIYCKPECEIAAGRQRRKGRHCHACRYCKIIFTSGNKNQKYCNSICYKLATRKARIIGNPFVCVIEGCSGVARTHNLCQKHYDRSKLGNEEEYRRCIVCGNSFRWRYVERICSDECKKEKVRAHSQQRRAKLLGSVVEDFTSKEIFERDNYICHLCGKRVRKKYKFPDTRCPTIDHIIPISRGGNHTKSNVKCAHHGCNIRKCNRTTDNGEQLLMFG